MKIFLLIRSLDVGGAERQLLLLSRGLADKGHEVSILVFYSGKLDSEVSSAVRLINLRKKSRWDLFGFLFRLYETVRKEKPDVLHSFLLIPNIYAALLKLFLPRVRMVWGLRSSNILEGHYTSMDKFSFYISAALSPLPDLIISNSETGRLYHQKYYRNDNMVSVPNGVDPSRFTINRTGGSRRREHWQISNGQVLIGNVGRLTLIKDHPLFLRALAELKKKGLDFKAVCAGSGPQAYKDSLLKLSQELGIEKQVIWEDQISDMSAAYSAFDLTVLCSQSESFPNVVLESMACGTPCVVTKGCGDAPIMVGSYGEIANHNPQDLANSCLLLLKRKNDWSPEVLSTAIHLKYGQGRLFDETEKILRG